MRSLLSLCSSSCVCVSRALGQPVFMCVFTRVNPQSHHAAKIQSTRINRIQNSSLSSGCLGNIQRSKKKKKNYQRVLIDNMNLPSAELQSPATAAGSNTPRDVHTNKPPPSPKQLIRPNNAVTKGVDRAILFTVRDLVDGNDHQVYSVTKNVFATERSAER